MQQKISDFIQIDKHKNNQLNQLHESLVYYNLFFKFFFYDSINYSACRNMSSVVYHKSLEVYSQQDKNQFQH